MDGIILPQVIHRPYFSMHRKRSVKLIFSVNINSAEVIYANKNKSKWQVFALFTQNTLQAIRIHFYHFD